MSVTKYGRDDAQLRRHQRRHPLHAGDLPRRRRRDHGRRGGRQRLGSAASLRVPASYNEVITVSALADTDGKAGRPRRQPLLLVGRLRQGRHVRRLQQLRRRRRPHRARQVHLVDEARVRRTRTRRARRWRRRRSPVRSRSTRPAARTRPRPRSRKRSSTSATSTGRLDRPGQRPREAARRRRGSASLGHVRDRASAPAGSTGEDGGVDRRADHPRPAARRSSSGSGSASRTCRAAGPRRSARRASSAGPRTPTTMHRHVPAGTPRRSIRPARRRRRTRAGRDTIDGADPGRRRRPDGEGRRSATSRTACRLGSTRCTIRVAWPAATDPSSAIAGYEVQTSVDGGAWGYTVATSAKRPRGHRGRSGSTAPATDSGSAPRTAPATGVRGRRPPQPTRVYVVDDRSSSVIVQRQLGARVPTRTRRTAR